MAYLLSESIIHDLIHMDHWERSCGDILELAKPTQTIEVLYQNRDTRTIVYKILQPIIPPGDQQSTVPVMAIFKLAYGKDGLARLQRERDVYTRLVSLQGRGIPYCYGLYTAEDVMGHACLLLEYGGEAVGECSTWTVETKPWSFKSV